MKRRNKRLLVIFLLFAVLTTSVFCLPDGTFAATNKETAIMAPEPDPYVPNKEQAYDTDKLTLTQGLTYTKNGKEIEVTSAINTMEFAADPTCIEADGRIYVYGTLDQRSYAKLFASNGNAVGANHDPEGRYVFENIYDTKKLAVFSSADMVNWTDEGYIDLEKVPSANGGYASGKWAWNSWAPSALKYDCDGDGKDEYYIFFTNGGAVGYIKGETPTGPWKDELGRLLIVKEQIPNGMGNGIVWNFDPSVFVDDDGQAYIYWGGGHMAEARYPKTSRACRMKILPDRVEMDWDSIVELNAYYMFEDSEINKFQGKYVYSYCTNYQVPANDKYVKDGAAVSINAYLSDDPLNITCDPAKSKKGDPVFMGTLLKNPGAELYGEWYNNHHHMFEFKGKYYILYHTTALDQFLYKDFYASAGRLSLSYRNLHIDEIQVDVAGENPSIKIQPTYAGPEQAEYFNPYQVINATTQSHQGGLTRTVLDNGTVVLDKIDTGDWTRIDGVNFGEDGALGVKASISSSTVRGSIEVWLDEALTGTKIATLPLLNTGSGKYTTVSASLEKVTGVHDVYFVFRGSGYQVASWEFTKKETESTGLTANQVKLAVPAIKDVKAIGNGKVKVILTGSVADAAGYEFRYSSESDMSSADKVKIKKATKLKKSISGLKSGTCYIQTRSYTVINGKKYYSKWSDIRSVEVSK